MRNARKRFAADSEKLLKMTTELKQGLLDQTDRDTLSIGSICKIDEIQKLAKDMKEGLRLRVIDAGEF